MVLKGNKLPISHGTTAQKPLHLTVNLSDWIASLRGDLSQRLRDYPAGQQHIAWEMGISRNTLHKFTEGHQDVSLHTVYRIKDWVMEQERQS